MGPARFHCATLLWLAQIDIKLRNKLNKTVCQKWDSNPRPQKWTATWTQRLRKLGHPDIVQINSRLDCVEPEEECLRQGGRKQSNITGAKRVKNHWFACLTPYPILGPYEVRALITRIIAFTLQLVSAKTQNPRVGKWNPNNFGLNKNLESFAQFIFTSSGYIFYRTRQLYFTWKF